MDATAEKDALGDRSRLRVAADLVLILSGSIFTGLLTIAVSPILPQLMEHFGSGVDAKLLAQLVMVVPCIGVIIGGPLMGGLVDRYGTQRVLLISTSSYAVLGVIGLLAESLTSLVASRFILGIAASGIYCATFTLLGERFTGDTRARLLGYKGAVGAGGATITVLSAGMIAQSYGWRAVFVLYLLAVVAFLLALGIRSSTRVSAQAQAPTSVAPLFAMWPIFLMMILIFSATFTTHGQGAFLMAANGIPRSDVMSRVLASASFAYMVASASYGWMRAMFGAQTTFRLGLGIVAFGAAGAALLTGGAVVTAMCFAAMGLGNGLTAPYLHNLVLERAPAGVRGRASGLVSPTHYAGEFLNPFIFQVFMFAGSIYRAFLILGGCLLAAAVLLRPDRWRRVDEATADTPPLGALEPIQKGTAT